MMCANATMHFCGEGKEQEGGRQGAGIEGGSMTGKTKRVVTHLFLDKAPCDVVAIAYISQSAG